MQRHFSTGKTLEAGTPPPIGYSRLDDQFMQKIQTLITARMDDPELGIVDLCTSVHLSSTQLFRKMKALTGVSPVRYLQQQRLARARQLLETTRESVSAIAYTTGFSDPNYFSRAFQKHFGMAPSLLRKENK